MRMDLPAQADVPQARSALTSILPLFAADMFADLGWGWGGTLLAGIAVVAVPAPMIVSFAMRPLPAHTKMFFYGRRLRERYAFKG
jgi:DHA1 family multidrug resistance protein-like MFS transporter